MTTHLKNIEITKTTKNGLSLNRPIFEKIKEEILGKEYNLSLVFIGNYLSKKLNKKHRKKDKTTNVLSFPLSDSEGEIFINIRKSKTECKKHHMKFEKFIIFLFIHGLLHLKGMKHSSKMEEQENLLLKRLCPKIYQ